MTTSHTGPFSAHNGYLMRDTATARVQVSNGEAACLLNDLLAALQGVVIGLHGTTDPLHMTILDVVQAAITKAVQS